METTTIMIMIILVLTLVIIVQAITIIFITDRMNDWLDVLYQKSYSKCIASEKEKHNAVKIVTYSIVRRTPQP